MAVAATLAPALGTFRLSNDFRRSAYVERRLTGGSNTAVDRSGEQDPLMIDLQTFGRL
jgi:hypothetical protein